jgi:hypothetical protein
MEDEEGSPSGLCQGCNVSGLWETDIVFPAGIHDKCNVSNVAAAAMWDCKGALCAEGGCLMMAGPLKLLLCRQDFEDEVKGYGNTAGRKMLLADAIKLGFDAVTKKEMLIPVSVKAGKQREIIKLCMKGFGLGVASCCRSLFAQIRGAVRKSRIIQAAEPPKEYRNSVSNATLLANAWLTKHYGSAEFDPVPGAKRVVQFLTPKSTLETVFNAYKGDIGDGALGKEAFRLLLRSDHEVA